MYRCCGVLDCPDFREVGNFFGDLNDVRGAGDLLFRDLPVITLRIGDYFGGGYPSGGGDPLGGGDP